MSVLRGCLVDGAREGCYFDLDGIGVDACEAVVCLNTKRATHTQFVELKYMNRHKPNGTLRAKQKVSIRCIMCGDMRRVAKVVVVWVSCGREWSGCEVCVRAMCGRGLCGCATSSGQTSCEV
ncbi:hypothetical protein HID58_046633, partial [Brassica napus]